jgi:EAL domain-containing protein (putative c-di-GMP-specific phosphodiesterase class I)
MESEREFFTSMIEKNRAGLFVAHTGTGRYAVVAEREPRIRAVRETLDARLGMQADGTGARRWPRFRACELAVPGDSADLHRVFQVQYSLTGIPPYVNRRVLSIGDLPLADRERALKVERAIRSALEAASFEVYYQPIVSARTGRVVSAEALLRLRDVELGWIAPDEFIVIAENNGSIHRVGEFVLERACEFLSGLRASGRRLDYIEVNMSVAQCIQANLADHLRAKVRRYGLEPSDLCLEITETAASHSPAMMGRTVQQVADAGFPIAIDDFGTGYSNLVNLIGMPFGIVKLDRSLVLQMDKPEGGAVGVRSIVTMFSAMGVSLVAEGVETDDQLSALREAGVDYIQGYYYSRPLPAGSFIEYLDELEAGCTS